MQNLQQKIAWLGFKLSESGVIPLKDTTIANKPYQSLEIGRNCVRFLGQLKNCEFCLQFRLFSEAC